MSQSISAISHIQKRIWLITGLFVFSILLGIAADLQSLRQTLIQEKSQQTQQLVESAHSVLQHFEALQKSQKLSKSAAQTAATEAIRTVRYSGNEYFWINDTTQPFPIMVMHPTTPLLEGMALSSPDFISATAVKLGNSQNHRDEFQTLPHPENLFVAMNVVVEKSGQGFVRYQWSKPLKDGNATHQVFEKLSYVKGFAPWGWVIGSGIYIDDVEQAVSVQFHKQLIRTIIITLILIAIAYLITRQVHAIESSLVLQKSQMQALIDATPESILLLNEKGIIQAINQLGAGRFNRSSVEMQGVNFFDLMPDSLKASHKAACEEVIRTGELMVIRDERNGIQFENCIYPVLDESGKAVSLAVYAKDITTQRRDTAINDMFQHLDTVVLKWQMDQKSVAQIFCDGILPIFNLSSAWIAKVDQQGSLSLLGQSELSQPWINGSTPNWPKLSLTLKSGKREIHLGGNTEQPEYQAAITLPISIKDSIWGVLVLYSPRPEVLEREQSRLAAITARLSGSLESALQQERLALLDIVLTNINPAVQVLDANGKIVWINKSFSELFGYRASEVIGQTTELVVEPFDTKKILRWSREITLRHKNGTVLMVEETITPILGDDRKPTNFVCTLTLVV